MKTLAIMMMLLFVAGTAFGAYHDDGNGSADPNDVTGSDYFHESGMSLGSDPGSDPIVSDSLVDGNAYEWAPSSDDNDTFNFEVGDTFDLHITSFHGYMKVANGYNLAGPDIHYTLNGVVQVGTAPNPGDNVSLFGLPAGEYSWRVLCWNSAPYQNVWGDWSVEIDVLSDTGAPAVPEPAGLGLAGIALLGLRKRRS